jgi:hypothetical protein
VAQGLVALLMRKSAGSEMRVQRRKTMGSKVPDSCPMRGFKGLSAPARLQCRARRVSETCAHACASGKTRAHSRDASIPAVYGNLQRPRAVISSGHFRHVGRDAHVHYFVRICHVVHDAHDNRYNHDDHNYPVKVSPFTTVTITDKSPRVSLQLTHGLRAYIRWMNSRAPTGNNEEQHQHQAHSVEPERESSTHPQARGLLTRARIRAPL